MTTRSQLFKFTLQSPKPSPRSERPRFDLSESVPFGLDEQEAPLSPALRGRRGSALEFAFTTIFQEQHNELVRLRAQLEIAGASTGRSDARELRVGEPHSCLRGFVEEVPMCAHSVTVPR